MLKKWLRKRGSAYLIAIGVLAVLGIVGVMVSKTTTAGRFNTILTSNEKRAEECAESTTNLMFKVVKDNMNDYSFFWKFFSDWSALQKCWFMFFRLPTFMVEAYCDPVSFADSKSNGVDIKLDLGKGVFKSLYAKGISYVYDTVTSPESELSPLKDMFASMGGRVRVTTTGRIRNAFGIIADSPDYVVGGVEVPLRKVTGFLGKLFDKVKIKGQEITDGVNNRLKDPTGDGDSSETPNIDLLNFLPNDPLIQVPDLSDEWYTVEGVPIPAGAIIENLVLKPLFKKVQEWLDLSIQGIAKKIFGDTFQFNIDFSKITSKIEEAIHKCLPECLQAFAGNVSWDITVEKQGIFEVETVVEYYPHYPDSEKKIVKRLIAQREFRVADIQPIAPDYTFFVANSKKLYEKQLENVDDWEGDDEISWNDGNGDIVIHNMPSLKAIWNTIKEVFSFDLKDVCRQAQLPGLVRINGTKKMQLKLTMFPKFSFDKDVIRKMEVLSLLLGHKDCNTSCGSNHEDSEKHSVIPGVKGVTYAFWEKGKPFDWGYMGGGKVGGIGSYWLPIPPRFGRTLLMGNFHIEFPMSLRVEGYLDKVYTHTKMLFVKIYIPPIPFFGILGFDIPIPWFWGNAHAEPYGFCKYPCYDPKKEDDAAKAFDPNEEGNLPANVYSPTQYLKKASYFYNSSSEFNRDLENRCIEYNGKKTFICDGVTFVNDNLRLKNLHVMGRGIIIAAANIHIDGDITREDYDKDGNATIFSIVARNGSVLSGYGKRDVYACVFADKGVQVPIGAGLNIHGNLCVNRLNRSDIDGDIEVYYESNHCRSSLLSMIRVISKYDPTRYYVTFSSKLASFQFVKPN